MEFTRSQFEAFKEDVKNALKEVAEKYGVDISTGKITYSDKSFDLKLNVSKNGYNQEKDDFEHFCEYYGFKKTDYNRKILLENKVYLLVGFNPRSKYPVLLQNVSNGNRLKATVEYVRKGELL